MTKKNVYIGLFALLGFLFLASAALLSVTSRKASVRLFYPSDEATVLTQTFMESVSTGDLESAASLFLGQPQLDADDQHSSPLSAVLWEAFTDSISYEFQGGLSVSGSGCSREVCVTALDIPAVMALLREQAPALLNQAAAASQREQIVDEAGSYREDFVMDVLCKGAETILKGQTPVVSRTYSLELVSQDGRWWILPQKDLTDLLSGSIPAQD